MMSTFKKSVLAAIGVAVAISGASAVEGSLHSGQNLTNVSIGLGQGSTAPYSHTR